MAYPLKLSTAATVVLGPFLDDTDGKTAETANIAAASILLHKKDGTTVAAKNDTSVGTHRANGMVTTSLNATDTNTLGPLVVEVHVAGALPVRLECSVLSASAYDFMYGATAPSVTVSDKAGFSLVTTEHTAIGTAVWATTTRTLSSFGTLVTDIWTNATRTLSSFAFGTSYVTVTDVTLGKGSPGATVKAYVSGTGRTTLISSSKVSDSGTWSLTLPAGATYELVFALSGKSQVLTITV